MSSTDLKRTREHFADDNMAKRFKGEVQAKKKQYQNYRYPEAGTVGPNNQFSGYRFSPYARVPPPGSAARIYLDSWVETGNQSDLDMYFSFLPPGGFASVNPQRNDKVRNDSAPFLPLPTNQLPVDAVDKPAAAAISEFGRTLKSDLYEVNVHIIPEHLRSESLIHSMWWLYDDEFKNGRLTKKECHEYKTNLAVYDTRYDGEKGSPLFLVLDGSTIFIKGRFFDQLYLLTTMTVDNFKGTFKLNHARTANKRVVEIIGVIRETLLKSFSEEESDNVLEEGDEDVDRYEVFGKYEYCP